MDNNTTRALNLMCTETAIQIGIYFDSTASLFSSQLLCKLNRIGEWVQTLRTQLSKVKMQIQARKMYEIENVIGEM